MQERTRLKIGTKLALIFLLVAVTPLVAASFAAYTGASETIQGQALDQLDSIASIQAARIQTATQDNVERFHLVAASVRLRENVDAYLNEPTPERQAAIEEILMVAEGSVQGFENLSVASLNGTVIASTDPARRGEDVGETPYFLGGRETETLGAFFENPNGSLAIHMGAPIHTRGEVIAVLVVEVNASHMITSVADYSGLGETGETLLVLRTAGGGFYVAPPRFVDAAGWDGSFPLETSGVPAIQAVLGGGTILPDAVDYRGEPVLVATQPLDGLDGGLAVKIDRTEALAPVQRLSQFFTAVLFATLSLVVFTSAYVAWSISRPLSDLQETAARIRGGDLTRRAPVTSSDEIGDLARSFNEMAEQLIHANTTLEKRVRERTAELERSNADLEQFAYVASHDLQEPLRMVASYTQLLQRRYQGKLGEDADEFIHFAVDGATRMQVLINDLLSYSRVGSRGNPFFPVTLNDPLAQAVHNLGKAIEESGAEIRADPLPRVRGDEPQLTQLFQNLLSNALKFRGEAPPRVHVSAEQGPAEAVVSVRDNGVGIAPEYAERVFGLFQRLQGRDKYPGTGIGLAVAKRIVDRHGGRIWLESEGPGTGTTFKFTLPLANPKPQPREPVPPKPARSFAERAEEIV